ncbi:IS66 family transposase [Paracoccus yibinensis]
MNPYPATLAHWPGLIRFLGNGTLELDANPVENQIRPTCGRSLA